MARWIIVPLGSLRHCFFSILARSVTLNCTLHANLICFASWWIVSYKGELWMRIVHSLGIETQGFVGRHLDAIMEMIVSSSTSQQVWQLSLFVTCLGVLCNNCHKYFPIPLVLFYFVQILSSVSFSPIHDLWTPKSNLRLISDTFCINQHNNKPLNVIVICHFHLKKKTFWTADRKTHLCILQYDLWTL